MYGNPYNLAIIANGRFLSVIRQMGSPPQVLDEWCSETKVSVNSDKAFAMIFIKIHKLTLLEPLRIKWQKSKLTPQ